MSVTFGRLKEDFLHSSSSKFLRKFFSKGIFLHACITVDLCWPLLLPWHFFWHQSVKAPTPKPRTQSQRWQLCQTLRKRNCNWKHPSYKLCCLLALEKWLIKPNFHCNSATNIKSSKSVWMPIRLHTLSVLMSSFCKTQSKQRRYE